MLTPCRYRPLHGLLQYQRRLPLGSLSGHQLASRGAIRKLPTRSRSSDLKLEDLDIGAGPTVVLRIAAWSLLSTYTRPSPDAGQSGSQNSRFYGVMLPRLVRLLAVVLTW